MIFSFFSNSTRPVTDKKDVAHVSSSSGGQRYRDPGTSSSQGNRHRSVHHSSSNREEPAGGIDPNELQAQIAAYEEF